MGCETPVFDRSDSEQFCRSKVGLFCLACGQKPEIMEFIKGLEDEDKPDVVSPPEPVRQRRNAVWLQDIPQAGIADTFRTQRQLDLRKRMLYGSSLDDDKLKQIFKHGLPSLTITNAFANQFYSGLGCEPVLRNAKKDRR